VTELRILGIWTAAGQIEREAMDPRLLVEH
jgi:hypothetical protein